MSKLIRVQDLPNPADRMIGNVYHKGPFLCCTSCGGEYSANRGDYFAAKPDLVLRCCGVPMRLVKRDSHLVEVTNWGGES
jgi:hypothetical protein